MTIRRQAVLFANALLVAAPVVWLNGAETTDPRTLLGTVRASTGLTVWPLDGVLKKAPGVDHWRVYLNDANVFESQPEAGRADAAINVALILREGDNLIAIESIGADGDAAERWTTHIHRGGGATARQFAVLAHGAGADASDAGPLAAFRKALTDHGVRREDVSTVSSWEALARAISDFGRRTSGKDRVLIYYVGPGSIRSTNAEPVLMFPKTPGAIDTVPVGNLVREASDLPSASVLLDIDYGSAAFNARAAAQQSPARASAPWLRGITQADSVELAFTSPALASSPAAQSGFTHDFIASFDAPDAPACATFSSMSQRIASVNAVKKTAAWPVFYSRSPTSFQFCESAGSSSRELHVTAAPSVSGSPPLRFAQIDLPRAAGMEDVRFELSVDGVPVQRGLRGARAATQQLPIGPGRHVVALTATPPASVSLAGTVGGETTGVRTQRRSADLTAELDSAIPTVTSDFGVTLPLVVGDRTDHPIRVEIRNNGVVVEQELIPNPSRDLRIQIARRIPLAIGPNNIAVDVKRDEQLASTRAIVVRRQSQPVRAVIVGVNRPRGAKTGLRHAASDADRIQKLVLQYTDAVPSGIRVLKDERATKQAIIDAITEVGALPVPDALVPFDGPGETFLLYFAGFGVSFADAAGKPPVRCLLPADFSAASAARERETCLRTDDLDAMLDKVGRSLVIVDASYDGRAGAGSRTLKTFTSDPNWRLTSGTNHPDRAFLVASGANAPALENDRGGVFTVALDSAIRTRLDKASDDAQEMPLLDAYELAREATATGADGRQRQVPVMKGILSAPFAFVRKPASELKQEAAGIERAARADATSMRKTDADRLKRAALLYEKVLAVDEADGDAPLGRARALLLAGDLDDAAAAIDRALPPGAPSGSQAVDWIVTRAELEMRRGDLNAAIADAARASEWAPLRGDVSALLGMLYGAAGQHRKAFDVLQPLLVADRQTLTGEELGRVLLHTYVNLRQVDGPFAANTLLDAFLHTHRGRMWLLQTVYQNPIVEKMQPLTSWAVRGGHVNVEAPWAHLVALYLRKGRPYEERLTGFLDNAAKYDPRDPQAFACMLHFYVGMARLFDGKTSLAAGEFDQAVASGRRDYAEYWFAKAQHDRVAALTARR